MGSVSIPRLFTVIILAEMNGEAIADSQAIFYFGIHRFCHFLVALKSTDERERERDHLPFSEYK